MNGRCEICGKENTSLLCLYDLHICEDCEEDYRKRTEKDTKLTNNGERSGMTTEELKKFRNEVLSMAVEPPWCENMETLKSWVEGFETCQGQIIEIINSKIKNVDQQR